MNWNDFNSGEIDVTNAGQVLTNIRCPECGRLIFMDTTKSLATYPPKYLYWCNCGWSGTSYKSWLTHGLYKVVVGFNMNPGDESAKAIFEKDAANGVQEPLKPYAVNGLYGAHINACEDWELFVTPTDPIRGTYCVRAQGFVFQHTPACKDFSKRKEKTNE